MSMIMVRILSDKTIRLLNSYTVACKIDRGGVNPRIFDIPSQFLHNTRLLRLATPTTGYDKEICLRDTTTRTFTIFIDWLYFGNLEHGLFCAKTSFCENCKKDHDDVVQDDREDLLKPLTAEEDKRLENLITKTKSERDIIALYSFACKYEVKALREAIVDAQWSFYQHGAPWYRDILFLSRDPLTNGTPLHRLYLDGLLNNFGDVDEHVCADEVRLAQKLPPDLLHRILLNVKSGEKTLKSRCAYHEHEQDDKGIKTCEEARKVLKKRKRAEFERDYGNLENE